jgi:cyclase
MLARKGAAIIASEACRSIMATTGTKEFSIKIAEDNELREKFKLDVLSLPEITTDERLYLNLGEHTLEIIFVGHAHTPGDMVVYLAEEEILFAGDVLFNGCHPVTRNTDTANWLKILADLGQKPIRLTVPGHGEPDSGKRNLENLPELL